MRPRPLAAVSSGRTRRGAFVERRILHDLDRLPRWFRRGASSALVARRAHRAFCSPGAETAAVRIASRRPRPRTREQLEHRRPGSRCFSAPSRRRRQTSADASWQRRVPGEMVARAAAGRKAKKQLARGHRPCEHELAPLTRDAVWPLTSVDLKRARPTFGRSRRPTRRFPAQVIAAGRPREARALAVRAMRGKNRDANRCAQIGDHQRVGHAVDRQVRADTAFESRRLNSTCTPPTGPTSRRSLLRRRCRHRRAKIDPLRPPAPGRRRARPPARSALHARDRSSFAAVNPARRRVPSRSVIAGPLTGIRDVPVVRVLRRDRHVRR